MAAGIDRRALRGSEGSFPDELSAGLADRRFPTVTVNFPRSYVDVNREPYELDPRMFSGRLPSFANTRSMRVAGGLGTIPRVVGDGQEAVGIGRQVDADDLRLLVHDVVDEPRILMREAVVILPPDVRCKQLV